MPLDCPRCENASLTEQRVRSPGAAVDVHVCQQCRGVWLDGHTLVTICPTLSHLPDHEAEVALLGRQGAGIAKCLRCGVAPFEYDVLEVAIDFCLQCHGVWLDGDEYNESMLEGDAPADEARGGPYRQTARAVAGKEIECASCRRPLAGSRWYVREAGPTCAPCHFAYEQARANERALESTGVRETGGASILRNIALALAEQLRNGRF
jgi:Zn-finger nucleic acid-binding protein